MVAHVLRLRLALLVGAARPGARDRGRHVAGLVLVLVGVAVALTGLLALTHASPTAVSVVTVVGGSALTLGAVVAPSIMGDADQLDPRRFAPFGATARPLAGATLAASLLGVPMLAMLVTAAGVAVLWLRQGAGVAAVVGPLLGLVTILLLARLAGTLSAWLLRERRSRELSGLFLLVVLVVVVPVGVFFASLDWGRSVPSALLVAVQVLSFTPLGAAWSLPGYAQSGDPTGWVAFAVAVVGVAALTVAWYTLVARVLHAAGRPAAARPRGMSWFAVMPSTPGGAIAARSLIYWTHDPRYRVNVAIVPVAGLAIVPPLLIAGVPGELVALAPLAVVALFFGWLPHNDLAYDSTALWLHIAAGVRGFSDRAGRLLPILLVGIPVLAVGVPLSVAISGRWAHAPALIGVCASLFLAGLGLSSIASAAAPYPVSRPGDSPFQQPVRTSGGGILSQTLVMLGALAASAPALWWGVLAVMVDPAYGMLALAAGLGAGLVVLGIGLAVGSAVFAHRGSALMEFAETTA
ncbi:MAG: hypothetical protein QM626_00660 [Microbacterium sp.]|uniref:hypothetical protein n=1 Tax=Microbacterium sp. TaxID=51671 RepID=UPI0039E3086A